MEIRRQLDINNYLEDINKFLGIMKYWCQMANSYKYKYNINEYNSIIGELKTIWHEFRANKNIRLTDDNELDSEIIEEDFPELKNL